MSGIMDGPRSPLFVPLAMQGNAALADLAAVGVPEAMASAARAVPAPEGTCVSWGIPFEVGSVVALANRPVTVPLAARARWLIFLHTSDIRPLAPEVGGHYAPNHGWGALAEDAALYVVQYADGSEIPLPIRRRHQVGAYGRGWGENCFEAVAHRKPHAVRGAQEQLREHWGWTQTRATPEDGGPWVNWLWAWENPRPEAEIAGIRFEPRIGAMVISGVTAGDVASTPLRWRTRRKALLHLPQGQAFQPNLDGQGLLAQVQLDLGQVISATPRLMYPDADWAATNNNQLPELPAGQVLVEYTAHEAARFYLPDGRTLPVTEVEAGGAADALEPVAPATQRVRLRVVERAGGKPVAAKLHVHGQAGEYLAPVDRHRLPNYAWFEDYSVDFGHLGIHACSYIPGETTLDMPLGRVYVEVSKGFEIRPIRRVLEIGPDTREVTIVVERVLPWRERGWVTADTHVHFLSPMSALLEGAGEGVNVVNLLASQWGELMTNVGDFDGRTTFGSREAGGDGEYLVRVGTENRQHVLGHISLLGYGGPIIAPMTTGGPDESALGDPIACLLTEWAQQCKAQGGLVIVPHFPNPRAEHAAAIVSGGVDGVEMTSWGDLYSGINPYSLVDWYRYLNCGFCVAAVGGTDKMTASTAVGTVRTYARIRPEDAFTYDAWKDAVRRAETFVTYGPLLEFHVAGQPMGARLHLPATGGTLDVEWSAASVTIPMTRVELIVNGEVRESQSVEGGQAAGHWSVRVDGSSWMALLVRGQFAGKPEVVAAHSSPVMAEVDGSPFHAAADAVTILEQIEGAMAYLDTVGTRAEDAVYRRMRLVLESAHRTLHNRMHQQGHYHTHSPVDDHAAHHG
ncbi:MAG: CehA/McbA family metallohydrolase [Anaerolineae bacterium]